VVDTAHEYGGLKNVTYTCGNEVVLNLDDNNILITHGHQYGKKDLLSKAEARHGKKIHTFLRGHYHRFSMVYENVVDDIQTAIITVPSVVGDTDFSDSLFVSAHPGFVKLTFDTVDNTIGAKPIRLT